MIAPAIFLQVGGVMPVGSLPCLWEAATLIMIGQHKQGDVWIKGQGDVLCPEVCRHDKYKIADGYLTPANNQLTVLNSAFKYSILPAKGERVVMTFFLMRPEQVAPHQHVLLTKHSFPAPAFADLVRKRLTNKGIDPYQEDVDMKELRDCADEALDTNSLLVLLVLLGLEPRVRSWRRAAHTHAS